MKYLATTFSPMMLADWTRASVQHVDISEIPDGLRSIVGHEVTAAILQAMLEQPVKFNRTPVCLKPGDVLYCVVPKFRADEAREFTKEEVTEAGFKAFKVKVAWQMSFFIFYCDRCGMSEAAPDGTCFLCERR